ncbi:glycosyltransferase family 2 protein [Luteibacter sp. 3190]|uniref:glycosyltransferase family 2 protein n=1 Tax=Luteibacter sp. 3190 TaxID=2817736 RepID=UPI0028606F26|nr:glycosyltransferase family 2 protein [Luteibacter sp. 3190]MDR6936849.1 dolichol-phosphate mannosyltransferase [Luteibacter sp. 3190]
MPARSPKLSVVSPVYCCANCLIDLHSRIVASVTEITPDYEIVLVCDASPDDSWPVIQQLAAQDSRVRGFLLSRNFGQHYAITAGLDAARGDWIIVMDCDLQDRPEEIPRLYAEAMKGYDVVFGARAERQDSALKRAGSRTFYGILNYLSDAHHDARTANFGIFSKQVIDVLRRMPEPNRAFPIQVKWAGFKQTLIEVQHDARAEGKSSYSLRKLLKLAVDITLSYSDKPLRLSAYLGFVFAVGALVYGSVVFARYLAGEVMVSGYTSLILSVWLLGGIILFCLGVLGLYLGRVYESAKGRPVYIVAKSTVDETGFPTPPINTASSR